MTEELNTYIQNNPWIKSKKYLTYVLSFFIQNTIPKLNLDNISSFKELNKFLDFWKLYKPYPNEIYLYIAALSKEDKLLVKDKHLKELINLGINEFSIKTENLELLQYLIENNFLTNYGALINASHIGVLGVVKYLVNNGANIHTKNDEVLRWASINGNKNVVEYLVDNGADVNVADDYALRYASANGHLEVVKYLVDHGANVNARDNESLRLASKNGHKDVVTFLTEKSGPGGVTFLTENSGPQV